MTPGSRSSPGWASTTRGALTASLLVVVEHEIDYLAPLTFRPAPIAVEVGVPRIGRSSVDIAYEVVDEPGTVYLRARSRMVQLDSATHAARAFDPDERAVFAAYPGEEPLLHVW